MFRWGYFWLDILLLLNLVLNPCQVQYFVTDGTLIFHCSSSSSSMQYHFYCWQKHTTQILGEAKQYVIWMEQSHTDLWSTLSPGLHNHVWDSLIINGGDDERERGHIQQNPHEYWSCQSLIKVMFFFSKRDLSVEQWRHESRRGKLTETSWDDSKRMW